MSVVSSIRSRVRILIVDDSAFMRVALTRMIASESAFEVVGTACSGSEALEKIPALDPDVVTLDLQMPGLDGIETLRCIMLQFPRPVVVVSATSTKRAETTCTALALGAFDCVSKEMSASSLEISHIREELLTKLRSAAQSRLPGPESNPRERALSSPTTHEPTASCEVVAIGASTGGPGALEKILPMLPTDFPAPILIVQHMPPGFTAPFAARLNQLCSITVLEAGYEGPIHPGVAYLAPAGQHMTLQRRSSSTISICLSREPSDSPHTPSIDLMMKSAAQVFGNRTLGVILTGMGNDGAEGIRTIHQYGGVTLGQDESTCVVYGMPRACAEGGTLTSIAPISQIPSRILDAVCYRRTAEHPLLTNR